MYKLKREQFLPISSEEAWTFFSSPKNLSMITPPDMGFKIVSGTESDEMKEGQIINYIVKPIFYIPLQWRTMIRDVVKPEQFTDIQLKGPYLIWEHSHRFVPVEGGISMIDEVNYKLPIGLLGRIMHQLFIRKRIEFIFNYRYTMLEKLFTN